LGRRRRADPAPEVLELARAVPRLHCILVRHGATQRESESATRARRRGPSEAEKVLLVLESCFPRLSMSQLRGRTTLTAPCTTSYDPAALYKLLKRSCSSSTESLLLAPLDERSVALGHDPPVRPIANAERQLSSDNRRERTRASLSWTHLSLSTSSSSSLVPCLRCMNVCGAAWPSSPSSCCGTCCSCERGDLACVVGPVGSEKAEGPKAAGCGRARGGAGQRAQEGRDEEGEGRTSMLPVGTTRGWWPPSGR